MVLRRSAEDYLEAIYVLKQQKGEVHSIDVARHLDFSKPSVSRAVNNLKVDGYLDMMKDGELVFTATGEEAARNIYERHTVLTEFFCGLGVPREVAAEDACRVEHAISAETFACIKATYQSGRADAAEAPAPAADGTAPAKKADGAKADKADKSGKRKKKKKSK